VKCIDSIHIIKFQESTMRSQPQNQESYEQDAYATIAREWWAQRWIDVLEGFGFRQRMARARNYAKEGNVLSLEFTQSSVVAVVQGSAPEPYNVQFHLEPFSDEQWGYVVESLAEQALFSAKLLSGQMPQTIEEVFTANGLSLFPFNQFDIHSDCDCPDPVNPCKHIGAVYYLLGDRFGEDPFVLFQLRGRNKAEIIQALRDRRAEINLDDSSLIDLSELDAAVTPTVETLQDPYSVEAFWNYSQTIEPSLIFLVPSSDSVLDLIGSPRDMEPKIAAAWVAMIRDRHEQVSTAIVQSQ
jgi:uncharacterized Zn finger protein